MRNRKAFTLIELLVVIAIIGVLIGLLVPAVQRVREAASSVQCKNNLHQIGIALHNFHDSQHGFPAGYVSSTDSVGHDTGPGWGWGAYLLPYLEQDPVYQQIRFDLQISDPANAVPRTQLMKVFWCPSEKFWGTFTVNDGGGNPVCDVAYGSYVACNGNLGVSDHAADNDGAFLRNRRFTVANIPDGLSSTLFVGERSTTMSFTTWTGAVTNGSVPSQRDPAASELAPALVMSHCGPHLPNNPLVTDADAFSSNHIMGVNFLFGDASVHGINSSISTTVYDALATRDGNEPVDASQY
jgi:prepilin-type N-terminal cleavage/methylation domain-containing protein